MTKASLNDNETRRVCGKEGARVEIENVRSIPGTHQANDASELLILNRALLSALVQLPPAPNRDRRNWTWVWVMS